MRQLPRHMWRARPIFFLGYEVVQAVLVVFGLPRLELALP